MFRRLASKCGALAPVCLPFMMSNTGNSSSSLASMRAVSSSSTVTPLPNRILTGDTRNGTIDSVHVSWTDKVGIEAVSDTRMPAGPLLAMLDMCAARCAQKTADAASHITHKSYLTCTVGVTNTVFSCAILNGDAVRLDGRVVHCGSSSVGIYIRFYRLSPTTRMESLAGESFFTMVTITPDLKAAKIVPAMELTDPLDIAMHMRYANIREVQKENAMEQEKRKNIELTADDVDCPVNHAKQLQVTIGSTKREANRIFFTSFLNNNNTVFGGELMSWMERHAVHCGQMFTGNRNVYTIGMHSVAFDEPVYATDWLTLEAHVVYVRNTTMEVEVRLRAERQKTGDIITNRASFVLINNNDIGQKAIVPVGIDLKSASQEELQLFAHAKARYQHSVLRREKFKETMLEETGCCR